MPIATNPQTGEAVFLDQDGAWKPAQRAVNPETHEALAWDGAAWKPLPVSKGIMGYVDDAVRAVASGVTFGFADEIAAKADELTGKGTYAENVKKERARDKQIPAAISIPGEIAGGVAGTVAAAPALMAAAPAAVKQTLQGLPALLKYLGIGAVEGAVAGAGSAEEGDRLSGAAKGAALGAAVAPATAVAIKSATAAVRGVRHAVSPANAAKADLARAIGRDADTPADVAARLAATQSDRPGATVADVGGENVRGLVERVAQTPGAGRTQVVPALTKRQQEQAGRISDDLKALTGTNKTAMEAIDETIQARELAAAPLYEKAMAFDAKQVPEIVNVVGKEMSQGHGLAIIKSKEFRNTLQTEYGIGEEGIKNAPLMVIIDAWKKEVDGAIGEAGRRGNKRLSEVLTNMKNRVVSTVDTHNPDYAAARSAWAGKSAYLDSIEEGRGILAKNVSAEEMAGAFRNLGEPEKEAFRIGAVSSIINRMGSDPAKLGDMTKYLRSPQMLKKMAAMMPTTESAETWLRRMQFEVSSSNLTAKAMGNSATARRLAEQKDAQDLIADLAVDAIGHGTTSGMTLINKALVAGPKWLKDTLRSRTDKMLADILMNPAKGGAVGAMTPSRAAGSSSVLPAVAATAGAVNALQ